MSVSVDEEVPKEGHTVETVRALTKRYGDRYLPTGRRWQPKNQTQAVGFPQEVGRRPQDALSSEAKCVTGGGDN
jgi:hypothetical protein